MLRWVVTAILLLLVCLPRFNMWDPGPIAALTEGAKTSPWGHPIDVESYVRLVSYFRGEASAETMHAPFSFRPLAPFIAAAIPAAPKTALNLVNVGSQLLMLWVLDAIGATVGLGRRGRWAMGLLFAVSFPTFYYGAIGFIDPVAILLASILLLLVLRESSLAMILPVSVLAVLAKETNAAFTLLPLLGAIQSKRVDFKTLMGAASPFALAIGAHLTVRWALPFPAQDSLWTPTIALALSNLSRPRTYLSVLFVIAIPTSLALSAFFVGRVRQMIGVRSQTILLAGCGISVALYAYSVAAAHSDGRIIWIVYPFVLPFAATWFDQRNAVLPAWKAKDKAGRIAKSLITESSGADRR